MATLHSPKNKTKSQKSAPVQDQNENGALDRFEKSFNEQLAMWNNKIDRTVSESITNAINSNLTSQFSQITTALGDLSSTMKKLITDNANITKSIDEVHNRLSEVEKSCEFTSTWQDSMCKRMKSTDEYISQNKDLTQRVMALEGKIASLNQQSRQCNIEIANLPERRGENLLDVLGRLSKVVNIPIPTTDIVAVHRVPHADQKNTRPKNIIVKLTTKHLRDKIIAASRAKKGLNSNDLSISGMPQLIYLNEHLTLENKQLFRKCREEATKYSFKYVWIKHGVILARKTDTSPVVAVRFPNDLEKIKA